MTAEDARVARQRVEERMSRAAALLAFHTRDFAAENRAILAAELKRARRRERNARQAQP